MSAIDQIVSLMESMTFADKLSLNERIATAIRKEGGKAKKRAPKEDGEEKPKRKAAAGTLAWTAFVKHIKTTKPDAFEGITKESDKLQIVKGIRAEDMAAYDTFVAAWKSDYEAKQDELAEPKAVTAPSPVSASMTPAQKIAALKAAKAAAPAAPSPAAPAAAPAKKEVKEVKKKEVKKKEVKKPAKKEEKQLPILTLEEVDYWHDEETQGLWRKETDTFSGDNWVGYYQPGDEEEPIRYTENFGDE